MQHRAFRIVAVFLTVALCLSLSVVSHAATVSIAMTAGEGGSATASALSVEVGTSVTIRAIPDKGYRFEHWQVSGNVEIDENLSEQVIVVEEDLELKAHFVPDLYRVTVELAEQGGSFNFEDREFAPDTDVTVTASPDDGFAFTRWESGDVEIAAPDQTVFKFVMPHHDVVITGYFDPITYRFRVIAGTGGSVTVDGVAPNSRGEYECHYEDTFDLLAEPDENYLFAGWAVTNGADVTSPDNVSTTLICPASDFTVRAQFASSIKELIVTSTEGGSVSPREGVFRFGVENILDLLALPEEGYVFSTWECSSPDGKFTDPKDPSASFTMPDADCTVTAVFTKGGYRLTVLSTVGGRVGGSSTGNSDLNAQIPVIATPEEGYVFSHWESSVEGVLWDPAASETVVKMPGEDVKVTAIFALAGGVVQPPEQDDSDGNPARPFPWFPLIVVFVLSGIAITLIVIRERFNLSYRYLIRKWFKSLTGGNDDGDDT